MKPDVKLAGACGIYCGKCAIYLAYSKDDQERKKRIAENISKNFGKQTKPEQIVCDGCHAEDDLCWSNDCKLRVCCFEKGYGFCFECQEYPCTRLLEFGKQDERYEKAVSELAEMKRMGVERWVEKQVNS